MSLVILWCFMIDKDDYTFLVTVAIAFSRWTILWPFVGTIEGLFSNVFEKKFFFVIDWH